MKNLNPKAIIKSAQDLDLLYTVNKKLKTTDVVKEIDKVENTLEKLVKVSNNAITEEESYTIPEVVETL